jgi:hypothetical protein
LKKAARRYNKGKLRYDLISQEALKELVEVYTRGAHKYTLYKDSDGGTHKGSEISLQEAAGMEVVDSGADNWRKGLSWMDVLASVKRHIAAFELGEDIDEELGTKHLANAAWGMFCLLDYYKSYPQGDNRKHTYLNRPKIGLDIDEVICHWTKAWCEKFGYPIPESWHFSYSNKLHFESLGDSLEDFYLNIPAKIRPQDLPFEPHVYITSRSVPNELTMKWIQKHGFPTVPVVSVGLGESKLQAVLDSGVDWFVDDNFHTFVELNKAGICCWLMDAPHNRRYEVSYKRVYSLKDLV